MLDADWISLASWAAFRIGFLCKKSNLNNFLVGFVSLFYFSMVLKDFLYIYNYVHSSVKGDILCCIVSFAYILFNFGE